MYRSPFALAAAFPSAITDTTSTISQVGEFFEVLLPVMIVIIMIDITHIHMLFFKTRLPVVPMFMSDRVDVMIG